MNKEGLRFSYQMPGLLRHIYSLFRSTNTSLEKSRAIITDNESGVQLIIDPNEDELMNLVAKYLNEIRGPQRAVISNLTEKVNQHVLKAIFDKRQGNTSEWDRLTTMDFDQWIEWFKHPPLMNTAQWTEGVTQLGHKCFMERDYAEALRLFRQAAELGNATAQYRLGLMYDTGNGVARDDAEAIKWYRLAAEQGNTGAQQSLDLMFDEGRGAQYNLDLMFDEGPGSAQDNSDAEK